jgi:SAM-dependent methyltransferase
MYDINNICPICGGVFKDTSEHKDLVKCDFCGLYRARYLPSKHYLLAHLEKFLLSACFIEDTFKKRMEEAGAQLNFIEGFEREGRLYDIGCGPAFFLRRAKDRGWQVAGNDLSKACVNYAKDVFGIDINYGFFEDVVVPENYYDVFNIWNAFEHLLNPAEVLEKVYRALKPGGYVHIRVPNRDERTIQDKYEPEHTFEYTDKNLVQFLINKGFKVYFVTKHNGEVDIFCGKE